MDALAHPAEPSEQALTPVAPGSPTGDGFSVGAQVVQNCRLTDDTTRWIPFQIDFADYGAGPTKQDNAHADLAAGVEVRGAGDAGVLLASGDGDTEGCPTRGKLSPTDSFTTMVIFGGHHVRTTATWWPASRTGPRSSPARRLR